MYMKLVDWVIVGLVVAVVIGIVRFVKRYSSGVSDFLAGNRMAGRYLLTVAGEMGAIGAISVMARWEVGYHTGWGANWWAVLSQPFSVIMMLSGWIIYRYRQTRALTLSQFFEQRYSRSFRKATGLLAFVAGLINYGIFPSVGARFLIYVCGIPDYTVHIGALPISLSYAVVMALLLGFGLWVTLRGGQVAIMITDSLQGIILVSMVLVLTAFLMHTVSWQQISETLKSVPNADTVSMVNPFKTGKVREFNFWFYAIAIFGSFYARMAWQQNSGYNAAAKSPHEARMAGVLAILRSNVLITIMGFFAIAAYTIMHHPDFAAVAETVRLRLAEITNPALQKQMTVPIGVSSILPAGLLGCLVAVIISMAVTTDDTCLHSWGSIFVQDVIMPFRKKPFTPEGHMKVLRWSICGVALFAYLFSLFFLQTGYILMFFAITGAVFTAGAGAAIIGGLYWKRGTTSGAWAALIVGAVLSVSGIIIQQNPFTRLSFEVYAPDAASVKLNEVEAVSAGEGRWVCNVPVWRREEWFGVRISQTAQDGVSSAGTLYYAYGKQPPVKSVPAAIWPDALQAVRLSPAPGAVIPPGTSLVKNLYYTVRCVSGQWIYFISILSAIAVYIGFSLASRNVYDLDKLLHRGSYQTDDVQDKKPVRGWRALIGINSEFTPMDRKVYIGVTIWSYGWIIANLIILIINLIRVQDDDFWITYFKIQIAMFVILKLITLIWFGTGAVKNTVELLKALGSRTRDAADDGWVEKEK